MHSRRQFIGISSLAFLGLQRLTLGQVSEGKSPFGPLIKDPANILDLPKGFRYTVVSKFGEAMDDGYRVPGAPDGMAAFPGPDGKVILVCNHELGREMVKYGPFKDNTRLPEGFDHSLCFNPGNNGVDPSFGGTTNIVFNPKTGKKESQFISLLGTDRNCAGGAMPWGSWITCEEPALITGPVGGKHGWCFEVKATEKIGIQKPVALKALGRYRHEAVALDPDTGILYLTEDRGDGLLYRFLPAKKNDFSEGKLQALAVKGKKSADLRNYSPESKWPAAGEKLQLEWIDLKDTHAPEDDLRYRGHEAGAARFARGEGIHYTEDGSLYICCTDGGPSRHGQIFRLTPDAKGDTLELFIQPDENDLLTNGDNLCPAPWGGLVVCEDLIDSSFAEHTCLRYVSPEGQIHTIARNSSGNSEFAGSCFSPDGEWLFVNLQGRGMTLAITGPWKS